MLIILSFQVYAPFAEQNVLYIEQPECIKPFEDLWKAVCMVESTNNPLAINQEEQAYGIAQIRQCRIDHFNQLTGKKYTLQDCFNPVIAKEVFLRFAKPNLERTAKRWNGSGPMTEIYWNKVKKYL